MFNGKWETSVGSELKTDIVFLVSVVVNIANFQTAWGKQIVFIKGFWFAFVDWLRERLVLKTARLYENKILLTERGLFCPYLF